MRLVESVVAAELTDKKLLELLPEITEGLESLDREQLLRHFIAHSLADFSKQASSGKSVEAPREDSRDDRKQRRERRSNVSYTRLCMSAGRRQGYTVPQVIGMLNKNVPGGKIDLGKIDLQNNLTFIDVDAREASRVVAALSGVQDKGQEINLSIYDGAMGNDGGGKGDDRPRNKYRSLAANPAARAVLPRVRRSTVRGRGSNLQIRNRKVAAYFLGQSCQ